MNKNKKANKNSKNKLKNNSQAQLVHRKTKQNKIKQMQIKGWDRKSNDDAFIDFVIFVLIFYLFYQSNQIFRICYFSNSHKLFKKNKILY